MNVWTPETHEALEPLPYANGSAAFEIVRLDAGVYLTDTPTLPISTPYACSECFYLYENDLHKYWQAFVAISNNQPIDVWKASDHYEDFPSMWQNSVRDWILSEDVHFWIDTGSYGGNAIGLLYYESRHSLHKPSPSTGIACTVAIGVLGALIFGTAQPARPPRKLI